MKQWKRRYVVLTKENLLTFKDQNLSNPTEVINMDTCCTVKSSDEEINKQYSFKLEVQGGTIFYMYASDYSEKESWIGALGKAMIKPSVMIDDNFDNDYM